MAATLSKPRNQRQIIWAWLRANRMRFATVDEIRQRIRIAEGEAAREQAAASGKPIARRVLVRY